MEGTVLIKITESELKTLVSVLEEFANLDVDGGWKFSHKVLLKDFKRIKKQMDEKREEMRKEKK